MDGLGLTSILVLLSTFLGSSPVFAKDQCDWSCGKVSSSAQNARLYRQVQAALEGKSKCSLQDDFDHANRNLRVGALQAFAIASQSCDVPVNLQKRDRNFLMHAMMYQGLKLSAERNSYESKDFEPSQIYQNVDRLNCVFPVSDTSPLQVGDLMVSKDDAMVVDTVGADPFGIEGKLKEVSQGDPARLCSEWVNDPTQFKISIFHARGRSSFFPTYGKSTSLWVTAMSERALKTCVYRVTEAFSKGEGRPNTIIRENPIETKAPVLVLRFNSKSPACRTGHTELPVLLNKGTLHDLDCVQCCNFLGEDTFL